MNILVITFKKAWNIIDKLNTQVKTLIIMLLGILFMIFYTQSLSNTIISDYLKQIEKIDQQADKYTIEVAPKIQQCIDAIQRDNLECENVLLLNYHNSKKSLQGIRYLYLNCIVESIKGVNSNQVKQYWSDLEYMYYQDELSKIHNQGYFEIENIDSVKTQFPKLYKLLLISDAKSAVFYTIEGVESPIGIIIILYKNPRKFNKNNYDSYMSSQIQKLSTLLDYPNLKINE